MNKIASLVKEAEVRGVLAGLVDGGHLKIASVEDLEALTEVVSGAVEGYDYDLNTILSKTAEVIEYLENEGQDKEASEDEVDETAVMAAFGELSMMKMAGEIDDETFEKEASKLTAVRDALAVAGSKAKGLGKKVLDTATGKNVIKEFNNRKASGQAIKTMEGKFRSAGIKPENLGADHHWNLNMASAKGMRKNDTKNIVKEVGKTVGLAGAAGVSGKALYDKYKK